MENDIPHAIRDYRLATQFRRRHVIHAFDDPDAPPSSPQRKEYWKDERQQLGVGGQGRVILQTCTSGSRTYSQRAVKVIPLQDGGARRRYMRELEIIIKFSHDKYARHFVKTLGWYETETSLCIAMEFFPAGDLWTYVSDSEHAPLMEDDCRQITSQILRALIIMHSEGFAHRDIKPQNVLIQQCTPSTSTQSGSWWVKLADFGISRMFHADTHGNSTLIGTEEYMAPELWDRDDDVKIDHPATDMWALGVMTFFILTKLRLFQNRRYAFQYESSPDRLFPRGSLDDCRVSPDGQDFIRALLKPMPTDRLDSNAAGKHPWVNFEVQTGVEIPVSDSESSGSSSGRDSLDEGRWTPTNSSIPVASAVWTEEVLNGHMSMLSTEETTTKELAPPQPETNEPPETPMANTTGANPAPDNTLGGQALGAAEIESLFSAANRGRVETLKLYIDRVDFASGIVDGKGRSLLYMAAKYGSMEFAQLLIEQGADVATANKSGNYPIHAAAHYGHASMVKLLLDKGADIGTRDSKGSTPLKLASREGRIEVVRLLLKQGQTIDLADYSGCTPIGTAAHQGHAKVVRALLEHGADISAVDANGWGPINVAAERGHSEITQLLLEAGANLTVPDGNGRIPITSAAINGHMEVVELLLRKTPDRLGLKYNELSNVEIAASQGYVEVLKLMHERGVEVVGPGERGWMPLSKAAKHGHVEVAKFLIALGAEVMPDTESGREPLGLAAANGRLEMVKLLAESGADVARPLKGGKTPLYIAAKYGYAEVVELLAELGADISATSPALRFTPLSIAARGGHVEVIKALARLGADISDLRPNIIPPIALAAQHGQVEAVKVLAGLGADVMTRHTDQWKTPMQSAAEKGHVEVVKLLVHLGAGVTLPDGSSILSVVRRNDRDMFNLLVGLGAPPV